MEVRPDTEAEGWAFASFETVLNLEDHVKTGEDSSAVLAFPDMSTFALKPDSEIVIATPQENSSKIRLVVGDIWINVKKVAQGGTMEVESNQMVAAIKGTTFTCRFVHGVDEIRMVHGRIEILLKETGEKITLEEGQRLTIKAGGRLEWGTCDPKGIQQEWRKDLEKMADGFELGQIPEVLKKTLGSETAGLQEVQEKLKRLSSQGSPSPADQAQFQKDCDRFQGLLMEHQFLLGGLKNRLTAALSQKALRPSERATLIDLQKLVEQGLKTHQNTLGALDRIQKDALQSGSGAGLDAGEADRFVADMGTQFSEIDSLLAELTANPNGRSQDWFLTAAERCSDAIDRLAQASERASELLARFPKHAALLAIPRQIGSYQARLSTLLRNLTVIEIDPSILTEMTENEELMSQAIFDLNAEIAAYDAIVPRSPADTKRLQASLRILDLFSRARKQYEKNQRLYTSITRATATQKYRTRELVELDTTFARVSNTFQQLGIVIEQLKGRLRELEGQVGPLLR